MTRLLQRRGAVSLHVAGAGLRGLQLAEDVRPDLVLLDLPLPDLAGETVLQRLRALPDFRTVPVLVLSADASPACRARLHAAGVTAYLAEPLDVAGFIAHSHAPEPRPPVPGSVTMAGSAA